MIIIATQFQNYAYLPYEETARINATLKIELNALRIKGQQAQIRKQELETNLLYTQEALEKRAPEAKISQANQNYVVTSDDLENRRRTIESYKSKLADATTEYAEIESQYSELQNTKDELEAQYKILKKSLNELKQKNGKESAQHSQISSKKPNDLAAKEKSLKTEISNLEEKHKTNQELLKQTQAHFKSLQSSLANSTEKKPDNQKSIKLINQTKQKIKDCKIALIREQKNRQTLQNNIQTLLKEFEATSQKVSAPKNTILLSKKDGSPYYITIQNLSDIELIRINFYSFFFGIFGYKFLKCCGAPQAPYLEMTAYALITVANAVYYGYVYTLKVSDEQRSKAVFIGWAIAFMGILAVELSELARAITI